MLLAPAACWLVVVDFYRRDHLGHAKLETTQLYTRVSITKLRAVHAACHPAGDGRPDTAEDHLRAV